MTAKIYELMIITVLLGAWCGGYAELAVCMPHNNATWLFALPKAPECSNHESIDSFAMFYRIWVSLTIS